MNAHHNSPEVVYDDILPNYAKLLPYSIPNGMLDHLTALATNVAISTDASQSKERAAGRNILPRTRLGRSHYGCPISFLSFSPN